MKTLIQGDIIRGKEAIVKTASMNRAREEQQKKWTKKILT